MSGKLTWENFDPVCFYGPNTVPPEEVGQGT